MPTFNVEVCRIGYGVHTIRVEADSFKDAAETALDQSGDHLYNEHHSEYEVNAVYDDNGRMQPYGVDGATELQLEAICQGLENATAVGEHCGNYPMTDGNDNPYDSDTDPVVLLCDAAAMAARIIDTLIANPTLAGRVLQAMKDRE